MSCAIHGAGAPAIPVTIFRSAGASRKREVHWTIAQMAREIRQTTAQEKTALPWLKLATFGEARTEKNSLRHDANVIAVYGVEADYDGEAVQPTAAAEKLKKAGVHAVVYTSPSHTPARPRWRVLCPLSTPCLPDQRGHYLGRLNGLFGGIFADESWALSQCYYYGKVGDNPAHMVEVIEGTPIDQHDDLDEIWIGKPNPTGLTGVKASGPMDENALLAEIASGKSYHRSITRLAGSWALKSVSMLETRVRLLAAMEAVPEVRRDARWKSRVADLDRILLDIYGKEAAKTDAEPRGAQRGEWGTPDLTVLRVGRRAAPALPLDTLGDRWAEWVAAAAAAAACPPDYVVLPLLSVASSLIGNARWPHVACAGWKEPPHLWCGVVGDSGSSKTPGANCLLGDVLPEIERRMAADFPARHRAWQAEAEAHKGRVDAWQKDIKEAEKRKGQPPPMPPDAPPPEPQEPCVRQNDVTIEKVANLLKNAAPKGLLIFRDELAGWLLGMTNYNDAGRAFWLEAWNGKPFRVSRQKNPEPLNVPHLAVSVFGGTQPEKLAELFRDSDDGLLARFCWAWPETIPFRLGQRPPDTQFAIEALDRLRRLELAPAIGDDDSAPVLVPLSNDAETVMQTFAQEMQERQEQAGGLMRSAYGKTRGLALRLSLVLALLRWCALNNGAPPPPHITAHDLEAACALVADYFMPMAERVFGDAAAPQVERNAATLARWIAKERPFAVHVRSLQRDVRLPGLRTAEAIHGAAAELVDAGWLQPPLKGAFQERAKAAYAVNPAVLAMRHD